jgi:hypothetical protein
MPKGKPRIYKNAILIHRNVAIGKHHDRTLRLLAKASNRNVSAVLRDILDAVFGLTTQKGDASPFPVAQTTPPLLNSQPPLGGEAGTEEE